MPIIQNLIPQTDGRGNRIVGSPVNPPGKSSITFNASNCTVIFEEDAQFFGGMTFSHDGSVVRIGKRSIIRGAMGVGEGSITFGEDVACAGNIEVVVFDGATVTVGDDCLFASGTQLRTWDQHPIYDLRTRKRINFGRDIRVGNRVWMAKDAVALPGSRIGDGSIVGLRSMVTASTPVPPHCVAVGQPAKVVKKYVAWAKGPAVPELPNAGSYPGPESMPYFKTDKAWPLDVRAVTTNLLARLGICR